MKYGVCVGSSAEQIRIAAQAGYDYVESGFSVLTDSGEEDFAAFRRALEENHIRCEAVNCFIPGRLPLVGENVDDAALREYIEKGMKRGKEVGLEIVVFGSGGARKMPDGWLYGDAVRQLVHFLRDVVTPIALAYGITVVVEPLCDTNTITTVREGAMLTAFTDTEPVKLLCDIYHMFKVGDTVDSMAGLNGMIRHSHIAEPEKRGFPKSVDEYDYRGFVSALEDAGCPRCSVEASTSDFAADAVLAAEVLKSLAI